MNRRHVWVRQFVYRLQNTKPKIIVLPLRGEGGKVNPFDDLA